MSAFEEFVQLTQRATRQDEIEPLFRKQICEDGYDNYVLATVVDRRMQSVPWCQLPDGYAQEYIRNRWDRIDPVFKAAVSTSYPFAWNSLTRYQSFSKREERFLDECRRQGVHSGLSFPIHGPGQRLDLISISLRSSSRANPERNSMLHAICVQAVTRFNELATPRKKRSCDVTQLTRREHECLCWLKEGKTIQEISIILGVSYKTIEFHVGNVYRKLGTNNRTGAVVVGIQQGLIPV